MNHFRRSPGPKRCLSQAGDRAARTTGTFLPNPARRKARCFLTHHLHTPTPSPAYAPAGPCTQPGSTFAGLSRSWVISRKAGYGATGKVIDMGRVEVEGSRIALASESPAKPWGLKPPVYVVVPWGERAYLVQDDLLLPFCNDVNSGRLVRPGGPGGL